MLTYLSVTSGIAADTVAWAPLGWECLAYAEIEPFPSAVLDYHYGCGAPEIMPSPLCAKTPKETRRMEAMASANAKLLSRDECCPPNLGDIRLVDGRRFMGVNVMMGGTPCQDFSVAGLRQGLTGDRGNLTLEFVRIADECDPDAVVWENVPGVLSDEGNAFGNFLSALVGADCAAEPGPRPPVGKSNKFWRWSRKRGRHVPKWSDAGWVDGPRRTAAWRVFDAQYFGLAQRRRRVFLIGCPRDGADPRAILFEREGLRRDTPPRREARAAVAGAITRSAYSGGLGGRPEGAAVGHVVAHNDVAGSLTARYGRNGGAANDDLTGHRLVTQALTGRLGGGGPDDNKAQGGFYVAAFGGNNTVGAIPVSPALNAHGGGSRRMDFESEALIAYPLRAQSQSAHDDSLETYVAHALRAEGFDASEDGTGRGTPLVGTIAIRGREGGCNMEMRTDGLANTVLTPSEGREGIGVGAILRESTVRRLTPTECEALQGFPRDYTAIPWRKKPASACPDGPRYKALGNSIAVPVLHWLGQRIEMALLPLPHLEICGTQEAV